MKLVTYSGDMLCVANYNEFFFLTWKKGAWFKTDGRTMAPVSGRNGK
jgi:hypothetical protein